MRGPQPEQQNGDDDDSDDDDNDDDDHQVSWLRERDRHILTVDRETFISDRRFVSLHSRTQISDLVTLSIHHVALGDAGQYQCQVSAQNKISRSVELVVVTPQVHTRNINSIYDLCFR